VWCSGRQNDGGEKDKWSVVDTKSFSTLLAEKTARLAWGTAFRTGRALECGIRDQRRAAITGREHGPGSEALTTGGKLLSKILFGMGAGNYFAMDIANFRRYMAAGSGILCKAVSDPGIISVIHR
jgi:hypothetical protein